jgi:tetratricopeptide (TPR) repeat protein
MHDIEHDLSVQSQAEDLYIKALILYDQQQYAECLTLLGQALPLERDNAHIYYSRGNARYELRDYRGAAAEYLWALRCAPYSVAAFNNLGNTYEALGQYEMSLVQYRHALQIEPENATLHYNLGGAYHALGRLPLALEALNIAIELDPAFAGCYLNRANVLSRLGRHEEALADYQQALAREPGDSNIAWTASWAQFGRESLSVAQAVELERISTLDPTHYTSHCCLAVLAYQHEDSQAALLHLEEAVTLASEQWDPHFWIGLVAAMTGETEVARQAIDHALELGLPPLLLAPLSWLKGARTDFFEQYAQELLQRFGI